MSTVISGVATRLSGGSGKFRAPDEETFPYLSQRVYDATPSSITLGVAVVKKPKSLGAIEASWDTKLIMSKSANGKAVTAMIMERPWYILSPNHRSMQYWNLVIITAMLFVSIVTP